VLAHHTPATEPVQRPALIPPIDPQGTEVFQGEAVILLQVLPSGICLSVPLSGPVVLGRGTDPGPEEFLDLSGFNAFRHGVSRRHCRFQRRDQHLIVTDLGSSNSTYLNNKRILPYQEHVVADGDKLILGTLHLTIYFSAQQ
jgi:pSer/pThr/pTyr-binding forkhead associated (FHA) protein